VQLFLPAQNSLNNNVLFLENIKYCGERQFMLENEYKYLNGHKFGKLELVDKEIFFISFNTRDN